MLHYIENHTIHTQWIYLVNSLPSILFPDKIDAFLTKLVAILSRCFVDKWAAILKYGRGQYIATRLATCYCACRLGVSVQRGVTSLTCKYDYWSMYYWFFINNLLIYPNIGCFTSSRNKRYHSNRENWSASLWIFPPNYLLIHTTGAHSHIRGLGLDDALEPRPVCYRRDIYNNNNNNTIIHTDIPRNGWTIEGTKSRWYYIRNGQGM